MVPFAALVLSVAAHGAGPAFIVADLNTAPPPYTDSSPGSFANLGTITVFRASDGVYGNELWRTDGTEAGTWMVRDIWPGQQSSSPGQFIPGDGVLFFTAVHPEYGCGIWYTDGTGAGTRPFGAPRPANEICGFLNNVTIQELTNAGGTLFFSFEDGQHGRELWKTDGTRAGTELVKDIAPGDNGNPRALTALGRTLFFLVPTERGRTELWRSDGSEAGTVLVDQVNPFPRESERDASEQTLVAIEGRLYFLAYDGAEWALYSMAEHDAAPSRVRTLPNGPYSCFYSPRIIPELREVNGALLFALEGTPRQPVLWRSDGAAEGTVPFVELPPVSSPSCDAGPDDFTQVPGFLLFSYNDRTNGRELWATDGTAAGTHLVRDIRPGPASGNPTLLRRAGDEIVFIAKPTEDECELWASDGTEAGTRLVRAFPPSSYACRTDRYSFGRTGDEMIVAPSGTILLNAGDPDVGTELFRSDGTPEGTALLKDINNPDGRTDHQSIEWLGTLGDAVVFGTGTALWRSDASSGGTFPLASVRAAGRGLVAGPYLFFVEYTSEGRSLWRTDGTVEGTLRLTPEILPLSAVLAALNEQMIVTTGVDWEHGLEPWISDGTVEGTHLLRDINPGQPGSDPDQWTVAGDQLFFAATDAEHGREVWRTDGTAEGTRLVRDVKWGRAGSGPSLLAALNGVLLFIGSNDLQGSGLWKTDGTWAGTSFVANAPAGDESVLIGDRVVFNQATSPWSLWATDGTELGTRMISDSPFFGPFVRVGEQAYFAGAGPNGGAELWLTDGTETGTRIVSQVGVGPDDGLQGEFAVAGDRLFFTGRNTAVGVELWTSDGTVAGTHLVRDINPALPYTFDGWDSFLRPIAVGRLVLFAGCDRLGCEPWLSDGSASGTYRVQDIAPGGLSSLGGPFLRAGRHVFFSADDGQHGRELWALPVDALQPRCVGDCNGNRTVTVEELVVAVSVSLGVQSVDSCDAVDLDENGQATVDELVSAVNALLAGCW